MNNNLSPILSFRKKTNNNPSILNNEKRDLKSMSSLITESRESIDTSEHS
ncbi:hypothetical protein LNI95_11760 [Tenacibaculum dicentrarchi]|nr:hypothetical protein [Tenacibaculum dicentrarchi]MCD8421174.1 hypothetical protein [Tenacibaculum dicentrarchi]MCD8438340.1 hypothetical protein [Tenacibaculum dicentrarchi]